MLKTLETAVPWLANWNAWHWGLWTALLVAALVLPWVTIFRARAESRNTYYDEYRDPLPTWVSVLIGVGLLFAAVGTFGIPGHMMRHLESEQHSNWLALGLVIAGVVLGIAGWARDESIWGAVPGGVLLVGAALGKVIDWLNRRASEIPTSVPVLLACGLAVVFWVWAASRRA